MEDFDYRSILVDSGIIVQWGEYSHQKQTKTKKTKKNLKTEQKQKVINEGVQR